LKSLLKDTSAKLETAQDRFNEKERKLLEQNKTLLRKVDTQLMENREMTYLNKESIKELQ